VNSETTPDPPLCVDLDGTLIKGDTLRLSVMAILRRRPWCLVSAVRGLASGGRLGFKVAVARHQQLTMSTLPWRSEVLDFLRSQRLAGRRMILATAAHRSIAEAAAAYLGLFDAVIASDRDANLKGKEKVAAIRRLTAGAEFDYAGDSWADVPVFAAARRCIVVSSNRRLISQIMGDGKVEAVFPD
jgi:phosphoserine phosphatase